MALSPFFGTSGSIFEPLFDISVFDPSGQGNEHSRQFAKDVSAVANTRVDWLETPEAHVFKADLPGLSKEEIKIQVDDGRILQISGERKKEAVEKNDKYHRVERAHGAFLRRFKLPEDANIDAIKAEVHNGVLSVTIPKAPKPQPRSIQVQ